MKTHPSHSDIPFNPLKFYGYLLLVLTTFGLIVTGIYYLVSKPGPRWSPPAQQQNPSIERPVTPNPGEAK